MYDPNIKNSGIKAAKEYFAQKAAGGTKTIEDYLGIWASLRKYTGNVGSKLSMSTIELALLFESSIILRQQNVYHSARQFGRTSHVFTFVAKTHAPTALQMKVAQALSAEPTTDHFGWVAPREIPDWEELYWNVLQEYIAYATCDPTTLSTYLALQRKDIPDKMRIPISKGQTKIKIDKSYLT